MTQEHDDAVIGLSARTGLSRRDLEAFIDAWERAGRPGTLIEFLGFVPEQRMSDTIDVSTDDTVDVAAAEHRQRA
jgi:hypothetical protein